MKFRFEFFIFLIVALLAINFISFASTAVVTVNLNTTSAWWNDSVMVSGNANYTNGDPISSGSVSVTVGSNICTNTTDANGAYFCSINAPLDLGTYTLLVSVTKASETFTNTTTLKVKATYGETPIGTVNRVAVELPMIIQEPSGKIEIAMVKVVVWR